MQERIVRRALSVYPDERYPSILDFSRELLATLQPQALSLPMTPIPATPTLPSLEPELEATPGQATRPLKTFVHTPHTEPATALEPEPQPGPIPPTVPDVPQPLPGRVPIPEPAPEPPTPPEPEPLPEPEPEVLPMPAPDIAQPFPQPSPPPGEPVDELAIPPHLIITSPFSETAQAVYLERRETTIGHAGSSDILLNQGTLTSRHHAVLKRDDDHYFIYDSRSTHGVFVNGQQVPCEIEYALSDGDHISIGEYTLHFRFKLPHPVGTEFILS